MLYSLFLYGIIDRIFKNILIRIGGQIGRSKYAMKGGHSTRTIGEGIKFLPFWCVRTN